MSWADYMMSCLTADSSLLEGCWDVVGGLHMVECFVANRSLSEDCWDVVGGLHGRVLHGKQELV